MLKCRHLLNENHHGFLPSKSCDTQMLYFQKSLMLSLNNDIKNDVVYFDFSKAYDSVNHDILLIKLKHEYGINGTLLTFLVNYWRKQTTMCCDRRPSV